MEAECRTPTPKKQRSLLSFWGSGGSPAQQPGSSSPLQLVLADASPAAKSPQEQAESSALVQQKASSPAGKSRGRPQKADGEAWKYTSLTGQQKLYLVTKIESMLKDGYSNKKAQEALRIELKCSLSTVKYTWRNREGHKQWGQEKDRLPSSRPGTARRRGERMSRTEKGSWSSGCRRPKKRGYLGREQHCRQLYEETKIWQDIERQQGHELFKKDLLDHFTRLLRSAAAYAQESQRQGTLSPEKSRQLAAWETKIERLRNNEYRTKWQATYVATFCGFVERAKQRTTCYTEEEEKRLVLQGWQCFDSLMSKAAFGTSEELELYCAQPERWAEKRKHTTLSFSDQVPVWLKASPDKALVATQVTHDRRKAKRARMSRPQVAAGEKQSEMAELQPRTVKRTAGNSSNSRYRVTLIARQIVTEYFSEDRRPEGKVDSSILVVVGTHARLEWIDEEGCWLVDHSFDYGGQRVVRKRGEKVGQIMASWRQLRTDAPELFRDRRVKVWQSPTAFVDSVIFSWQQDEESARFEPLIRVVDSLSTHWSQQALERNWLTQTIQGSVPAGCTPLVQITDTAMAMPAKAAGRAEHERQKSMLLLKANQEGAKPSFKCGVREVMLTARAMHKRMEELNASNGTVLSEARATGWLHYRPREGRLQRASEEPWAASLTEGTHKMDASFREHREDHVVDGKPEQMMLEMTPARLENTYWDDYEALALEGEPDVLSLVDQRKLDAALLHPSLRSEVEQELAEVMLMTSQLPRKRKGCKEGPAKKTKLERQEMVQAWKKELGSKAIAARLASMVPCTGKKVKTVKRQIIKKISGKLKQRSKKAKKAALKDGLAGGGDSEGYVSETYPFHSSGHPGAGKS